jgi:transcriptional regulator with XRE-family HTH domain
MSQRGVVVVEDGDPRSTAAEWGPGHGEALRRLRVERGLRQQELADAIGQPRTVLSNWENAIRKPAPAWRAALAAALQVDLKRLEGPEVLPAASAPDRWSALRASVQPLIADSEHRRLDRFIAQSDWFAALAGQELTAVRWNRMHAAAEPYRAQLQEVATRNASTPEFAKTLGAALATDVRGLLGWPTGPLPSLGVTAERCGIHLFVTLLSAGSDGRLRAAANEHERLGVTMLVNAALDDSGRLFVMTLLMGRLLLSPRPSVAVVSSETQAVRARRVPLFGAAVGFAEELILPEDAVRAEVNLAIATSGADPQDMTVRRSAVLTDLLAAYGAPLPVVMRRLSAVWKPPSSGLEEFGIPSQPRLWRAWSRVGQAETAAARLTVADLPGHFVTLLLKEVIAGRASLQAAAELAGVDVSELGALLGDAQADPDEVWLESDAAVA